ncbi:16S rRNA (guanine(527)-N(7))-methyltransferase RsmG [Polaromonas sp. DSR2-3-2]|uniref:16S rRNA (guanine(527)-N(7))-methyltransferase RsmG n=1 Tax=unclassified Polaromonas TaxID=2638319 RepID=UPI003CF6C407
MAALEKDLRATLLVGLAALQLKLSEPQISQLLNYQAMIGKWTQVYNLTSVRDPAEMMTHHLLDSLSVVPALQRYLLGAGLEQGSRLLDVGSGAGLPGVVIAICCPAVNVTCVDTVAKKAAFIKQAALALKLPNLAGLHARVESITEPFDIICSRAFASLADFTNWSMGALVPQGVWMAMKGKHPSDELLALSKNIAMFHVEQLKVPGLDAERCLLWLRPVS